MTPDLKCSGGQLSNCHYHVSVKKLLDYVNSVMLQIDRASRIHQAASFSTDALGLNRATSFSTDVLELVQATG
jgi:hypothetical protein